MADKPTVKYEVRAQRDPVNNVTIYVPAIVDRNAAKSLATVIENAIDRGLIVGVKPSAANGLIHVSAGVEVTITVTRRVYGEPYTSSPVTVTVATA